MKKIRCLLPLLLLALFTGCTLMIDEPETATTPQETENGDGITSPRRIVSDMGEVRYQIGPETRMIDKDYLPYLLTYKTDTLDRAAAWRVSCHGPNRCDSQRTGPPSEPCPHYRQRLYGRGVSCLL